jgi:hypothetical protein
LVVVYLPHVDAAAHVAGQGSDLYADALATVADVWAGLAEGLPPGAALMGTADHGHVDIPPAALVAVPASPGVAIGGDSRVMQLFGALPDVERLVDGLPGTLVERPDTDDLWGPGPFHPEFSARTPDALFLADAGSAFRFEGHDDPMVGHHGGLTAAEVEVPVLVSGA